MPDRLDPATPPNKALGQRVGQPDLVQFEKDEKGIRIIQRWPMSKAALLTILAELFGCYAYLFIWFCSRACVFSAIHPCGGFRNDNPLYGIGLYHQQHLYRADSGGLLVRFAPIPWPGKKMLKRSEIRQLFCKETTRYDRYRWVKYVYELHAATQDGRDVKLVGGQESPDVVRYFEQVLEPWLRIEDQSVDNIKWR